MSSSSASSSSGDEESVAEAPSDGHHADNVTVSFEKGAASRGAVLASFPQGLPAPESLGSFHQSKKAKKGSSLGLGPIQMQYLQHPKRKRQQFLQGENKVFSYTGASTGKAFRDSVKYAVGIYDSQTQTVKLIQADNVFRIQQKMKNAPETTKESEELTDKERRKMLIETFGSKVKKQQQRNREANRIDIDNVAGSESLSNILTDTTEKNLSLDDLDAGEQASVNPQEASQQAIEEAAMTARKNYLPPFNTNASSPEHAYPLDLLITADEGRGLKNVVDAVLKTLKKEDPSDVLKKQGYSPMVVESLSKLAKSNVDKKELKNKVRVHTYLDALLKLYSAPRQLKPSRKVADGLNKKQQGSEEAAGGGGEGVSMESARAIPVLSKFSEYLGQQLLEKFTEKQVEEAGIPTYSRTKLLRDRLMMYIACCALHINSQAMDIKPVAEELKIDPKNLYQYFRELGCNYKFLSQTKSYHVKLAVPLKFPAQRKKRSRG
eukprot:gb/GECG01015926.1/.p1 GENE.gb/GECG01015926.1/~~gb/GECG01015926.1/.p1  ORF type:complete len:492 (+),score=93.14 gb/GECG01015926.1/:1-1476(+)